MKKYTFEAEILTSEIGKGGAYVEFPYSCETEFGIKGRVPVVCNYEGNEYLGSLVKMNTSCHIIGISKEIRKKIGKDIGSFVKVELYKDDSERVVEINPDLKSELIANDLFSVYENMSYSMKKEYNDYLNDAKKPETKVKRIIKIIDALEKKRK